MGIKVSVEKCGDVWLVGDGGRIARALGADPGAVHNLSIGFVAEHSNHIGPYVAAMEGILTEFTQVLVRSNVARTAEQLANRAKTHLDKTGGPVPANGKGALPLDSLGLNNQQLWRLKAAGIKSILKLGGLTEEALLAKDGIGPSIVKAVKKGLKKKGLRLSAVVG